jgi:hypothetical protein
MKLIVVVCVSIAASSADAGFFCVYNNTKDLFTVERYLPHPDVILSDCECSCSEIKTEIPGDTNVLYHVSFPSCYSVHEKPFLSFRNEEYEFRIIFPKGNIATLDSSTATELHNDVEKDSYDYEYIGGCDAQYIGRIMNWLVVGPFRVVHFLEKAGRGRSFVIEYVTDDDSWLRKIEEDDWKCRTGEITYLPIPAKLRPKQHWWSKLFCSNCDE